jgi:hypothetical protein
VVVVDKMVRQRENREVAQQDQDQEQHVQEGLVVEQEQEDTRMDSVVIRQGNQDPRMDSVVVVGRVWVRRGIWVVETAEEGFATVQLEAKEWNRQDYGDPTNSHRHYRYYSSMSKCFRCEEHVCFLDSFFSSFFLFFSLLNLTLIFFFFWCQINTTR